MKKIKLIVMLCLVFVLVLTASCGSEPVGTETAPKTSATTTPGTLAETSAETTAPATTTAPVTTAPITTEKQTFSSLKIGETPLSDYTIVYAKSEYAGYLRIPSLKDYFPIHDFNRETAERLSDLIFDLSGIRLKAVEDEGSTASANEILIGKTNRTEAVKALGLDALTSDDYLIDVEGTRLVICGGEYGTTWHAIDYLESFLAGLLAKDTTEYAFASDYTYKGTHHLIRIACIGDSITEGAGSQSAAVLSYPAQMGRYLWKDALVTNLGSGGATMRNDLNAYTQRGVYQTALQIAAEIDIFTIMLGTNDSFYDGSWTSADSQLYTDDCLGIVKSLWEKNQNLQFVLSNCPRYFGSGGWASLTVRTLQKNLVPTLNSAGYPTTFFDMYTETMQMRDYFPDQLHPNDEGYMMMGEIFANALQPMIDSMQKQSIPSETASFGSGFLGKTPKNTCN